MSAYRDKIWQFQRYEDKTAVIDDFDCRLTYRQLAQEGNVLCEVIGRRCLVFIMAGNTLGSLIGYTGCLNHSIVPAMLKHDLDDRMLEELCKVYCPSYIWLPAKDKARKSIQEYELIYSAYDYILVRTPWNKGTVYSELALLLTTSGSTGSPKFVRQSYENIRSNTGSIVEYLRLDDTEKAITTLPMNYTYGLSIINTHLSVGGQILLTEASVIETRFWEFFRKYNATSFGGVPYTYEMLKRLHIFSMNLPSLRTMTQAGGKLSPELHREFAQYAQDTGRSFIVMYGQCEATARMAYLPAEKSLLKYGSMGVAIPGGRFELVDIDGQEITSAGIDGELVYYGGNVTLGYAERAVDLEKGDERNGRLETGDIARMDEDGYYYITGRKKRFLKIYGNRVNLDGAEQMLKEMFPEAEIACGGTDDHLYIFTTKESLQDEMRRYLSSKMGLNERAFITMAIDRIPQNESGKVLYRELEKYYN